MHYSHALHYAHVAGTTHYPLPHAIYAAEQHANRVVLYCAKAGRPGRTYVVY